MVENNQWHSHQFGKNCRDNTDTLLVYQRSDNNSYSEKKKLFVTGLLNKVFETVLRC